MFVVNPCLWIFSTQKEKKKKKSEYKVKSWAYILNIPRILYYNLFSIYLIYVQFLKILFLLNIIILLSNLFSKPNKLIKTNSSTRANHSNRALKHVAYMVQQECQELHWKFETNSSKYQFDLGMTATTFIYKHSQISTLIKKIKIKIKVKLITCRIGMVAITF